VTWLAIKVRVDCPECGLPVMLDGPWENMRCSACAHVTRVADLWADVLEIADEYGGSGKEFTLKTIMRGLLPTPNIACAVNKGHPPICGQCGEVLDEVSAVANGTEGVFHCPACGTAHPTWPAPKYMGKLAKQVFMAPKAQEPTGATAHAPAKEVKPVIFTCPACGANLSIGHEAKRLLSCQYCNADVFLPQELWLALHPIRKRQAFWVRTR